MNNKELVLLHGRKGREFIENKWSIEGMVDRIDKIYQDLVGKKIWLSDVHTDSLIYLFNKNEEDALFVFGITGIDTENDEYLIWLFNQIISTFKFIK